MPHMNAAASCVAPLLMRSEVRPAWLIVVVVAVCLSSVGFVAA